MVCWALLINSLPILASDEFPWLYSIADKQDASLRSCAAASLDRLWAVGDRGLAMRSEDGGKSWQPAKVPAEVNFHKVAFVDAQHGFIAGGFIWPVTNRSDGCLLRTEDGGQSWKSIALMSLPRITGMQVFSKDHLIVWGDWSAEHRSAMLESTDGGLTFQRKEVPCAQITTAAWMNPLQGVVVDRLSRVFVTQNGSDFLQVQLPCSPLSPIREAVVDEGRVWLSGDHAQLYKSADFRTWKRIHVETFAGLEPYLSLTSITAKSNKIWITTNLPGLLFSSSDGESFIVHQTETGMPLNSVAMVNDDQVYAVGDMANVVETRNQGVGWWNKSSGGNKLGLLAVAPTMKDLPTDAMVHSSLGQKQHSGAVVVHAQHAMESADAWPGPEQRLHVLGSVTCASWIRQLPEFPVGSLSSLKSRPIDLVTYEKPENGVSLVERKLVFLLRALRPDVVIVSSAESGSILGSRCTAATLQAIQLAGDPAYKIRSNDGFYDLPSWRVQRTLTRTARRTSNTLADWTIEPTELLGESGQTVADRVRTASILMEGVNQLDDLIDQDYLTGRNAKLTFSNALKWNRLDLYGDYWNRSGTRRTNTQSASYHAGILINGGSKRNVEDLKVRNLQVLMASMKSAKSFDVLIKADRSTESAKRKWLLDLQTFLDTMPSQDRARFLLELSLGYLSQSDWEGWRQCEEFTLAETGHTIWRDISQQLGFQIANSHEFRCAFDQNFRNRGYDFDKSANSTPGNSLVQPAAFVSPFENAASAGKQNIAQASSTEAKSTQPSSNGSDASKTDASMNAIRTLLLRSPVQVQADIRSQLALTAFENRQSTSNTKAIPPRWLAQAKDTSVFGWSSLVQAEIAYASNNNHSRLATTAIAKPPLLDGLLQDEVWNHAATVPLSSAWQDEVSRDAKVRFMFDSRFLYVGIECPLASQSNAEGENIAAQKTESDRNRRDQLTAEVDQVAIRFDIDRDYCSYFQFAVGRDGMKLDSVNQFLQWNPKWYVAQTENVDAWFAELAIPLEELGVQADGVTLFAVNAKRQIPGVGVQCIDGAPSDVWLPQLAKLVQLNAAARD